MNRLSQPNLEPAPGFGSPGPTVQHARHPAFDSAIHRRTSQVPLLPLANLKAVVLLAGAVGRSTFRSALDRAIVDLPLEHARTILSHWRDHCVALAQSIGSHGLPVRLLVDQTAQLPSVPQHPESLTRLSIERDPSELRGTAGLLRDIAQSYADDDWLLVANAVQVLRTPLAQLAADLAGQSAPVVVVSHSDGTPSGIMVIRCGCLREIPDIGYIDMKEQGLGMIARRHTVKVLQRPEPTGYPIRTYVNYLNALRLYHAASNGQSSGLDHWQSCFAIVEDGAEVSASATVHDSVVLKGARVEKGAVVINSVVCGSSVVRRGQTVTDELVTATGRR